MEKSAKKDENIHEFIKWIKWNIDHNRLCTTEHKTHHLVDEKSILPKLLEKRKRAFSDVIRATANNNQLSCDVFML